MKRDVWSVFGIEFVLKDFVRCVVVLVVGNKRVVFLCELVIIVN